ncbi:hypothetical protein PAMC26510_28280 [Caballeronia sordidicola]|uniref:Uncharacterized protein n=1 Tax=Caballeronia sordidicola TaxID=196367 RepID=A0A242MC06_CABSO|nr:hypothetical protein PAMC26510_28280 [Caballeronia sordidicola]
MRCTLRAPRGSHEKPAARVALDWTRLARGPSLLGAVVFISRDGANGGQRMIDRSGFAQFCRPAGTAFALCFCMVSAHATPGIKVMSEVANDGPIKYTVKMASKAWGNEQETRTIRSGQTDDFTWQSKPPGGAQNVPDACPDVGSIRNASGVTVRQVKIRFAAVIASNGDADVQMNFQGHTPRAATAVTVAGKKLQCPTDNSFSQMTHFTMPTGGAEKSVTLSDGTKLTVSASRK